METAALTIGGKAANLLKLKEAGVPVPEFFVLETPFTPRGLAQKIRSLFPGTKYFAVRSSAMSEDSEKKSYAGHFYTALGVELEQIPREVQKVRESFGQTDGAVIVQKFIASEKAGVMFSDAGDETAVINANRGLCDSVVKGWECDEYLVGGRGKVIRKNIPPAKKAKFFSNGRFEEITYGRRVLSDREIKNLYLLGKQVERLMGRPQDIEWCMSRSRVYCLQSRPITRGVFRAGARTYFDSANIAESYSGVVLPLTFSFAQLLYKNAYESLLAASGVARKSLESRGDVFAHLLGTYFGRMYYNMNNWYKMLAFLPGYRRNKENLEAMITSNIRDEIVKDIEPPLWLKVKYPFLVVFKMTFLSSKLKRFKKNVARCVSKVREASLEQMDLVQCKELFFELEKELLKDSYLPIENDFLVMTYFGILRKAYPEQLLRDAIQFGNISVEQVGDIHLLAKEMKSVPGLWVRIGAGDEAGFKEELLLHPAARARYEGYLHRYGGRFADELKLETESIEDNFEKFSELVKLYAERGVSMQKRLEGRLPGHFLKSKFFSLVLNRFRKYAARREELRLLRSNVFGLARKIIRRMGQVLAGSSIIAEARDVFYLNLEELLQAPSGQPVDYRNTIEQRKKEYGSYGAVKPPSHFSALPGEMPDAVSETPRCDGTIVGRPCTSGQVRGRVKVFKEFSMPEIIDFEIVVAKHTDPGWTPLIGLAKGLIVERGGILSHASIVSRELGIPTIIGALDATEILRDDQMVAIDGSTGLISILR